MATVALAFILGLALALRLSDLSTCSTSMGSGLQAGVALGAPVPPAQRAALEDLYNSAGGAGWAASVRTSWLVGDPCTPWVGVSCTTDANGTTLVR
jgi:hypothetical protein